MRWSSASARATRASRSSWPRSLRATAVMSPNLNLDTTGPGKNDVESTRIIGERQARTAQKLFEQAKETLCGPMEVRQMFVDFSSITVAAEFTGADEQRTSPSALGYAFAA